MQHKSRSKPSRVPEAGRILGVGRGAAYKAVHCCHCRLSGSIRSCSSRAPSRMHAPNPIHQMNFSTSVAAEIGPSCWRCVPSTCGPVMVQSSGRYPLKLRASIDWFASAYTVVSASH